MLVFACDAVFCAMDKYPINYDFYHVHEKANLGFAAVLLIEIIILLLAHGKWVFKNVYRILDFVLFALGIIEVIYTNITPDGYHELEMLLRPLRILRIIKVAKEFQAFR